MLPTRIRFAAGLTFVVVALTGSPAIPSRELAAQGAASTDTRLVDLDRRWSDAIQRGRTSMQGLVDRGAVPGAAVAVAVEGRVVWSEGFGFADIEQQVPATRHTRFGLGSLSKTFTMAAAMTLVDDGKLDLDAPVERYLRDFPHAGSGITVRRIAAHQSGLADEFARKQYFTTTHYTVDSAYRLIARERRVFEPGADTSYATGLYTIIGRVLEVVDGQPFVDLMQRRLFEPAGMRSAIANDPRAIIPHRTRFYVEATGGAFEHGPVVNPSHKLPGAGYLATAEDVARFGAALLRSDVLSARARAEMFTPVPLRDGRPTEFALGLRVARETGRRLLHQPGGGIGISTWLFIYPDQDLVIALLSNVPTGPVGGRVRREIAEAFLAAIPSGPTGHRHERH